MQKRKWPNLYSLFVVSFLLIADAWQVVQDILLELDYFQGLVVVNYHKYILCKNLARSKSPGQQGTNISRLTQNLFGT